MIIAHLVFQDIARLFSRVAIILYVSTNSGCEVKFLWVLTSTWCYFIVSAILILVPWYLIVVLICIYWWLMVLSVFHLYPLRNCCSCLFLTFKLLVFFFSLFMLSCESSLYVLDTSSLGDTIYSFSKSVACLFILLV